MPRFSIKQWSIWLVTLTALALLSFYDGLDNSFVFDDVAKIVDNPDVQLPEFSLSQFIYPYNEFKLHNRADPSRPLTFMVFWACWQIDGGKPWPFHAASIFFHTIAALLSGLLAAKLARRWGFDGEYPAALFTSAWYLTLPLNAGTVIYAYGMSDVLATVFMLASVLVIFDEVKWLRTGVGLFLYALALSSKQSAIVVPGLIVAVDYFSNRDYSFIRRRSPLYLALAAVSLGYLGLRLYYFGRIGDLEAYNQFRVSIYFPLQGIMFWNYLARVFLPINLAIEHAHNPSMFTYPQCYLTWTLIAAVSGAGVYYGRRSKWFAALAFGWSVFFISLSPTSTFFTTTDLFVERRAYTPNAFFLPALGAFLVGGWYQLELRSWYRRVWAGLAAVILTAHILITQWRVQVYGNEEWMWGEVIKAYPRDERAMVNLSTHYLRYYQFDKTLPLLTHLLKMYPDYYSGLINMGAYYQHPYNPDKNYETSYQYYKRALAIEPTNLSALTNIGLLLMDMKRWEESNAAFREIIRLNPNIAGAHFGLARVAFETGKLQAALKHTQDTLRLNPKHPEALVMMSRLADRGVR